MIDIPFKQQVDFVTEKISSGENFCLSRYGDGELAIIEGREISKDTQAYTVDGWHTDGNAGVFARDLRQSLERTEDNFYYAIPCTCCHGQENQNKYVDMISNKNNINPFNKTNATISYRIYPNYNNMTPTYQYYLNGDNNIIL